MGQRQRLTGELIESRVVGIRMAVGAEPGADQMLELFVDLVQPVQDDFDGLEQVLFDAGELGCLLGHGRITPAGLNKPAARRVRNRTDAPWAYAGPCGRRRSRVAGETIAGLTRLRPLSRAFTGR